jgi:DNA-binding NtrC family response regulator
MTFDTHRVLSFPPPLNRPSAYAGDEALLGPSPAIARVWAQIRRVAPHFRAAVITGEAGSGAEAAARSMHALSPVRDLPFTIVDAVQADQLLTNPAHATDRLFEGLIFLPDADKLSTAAQRSLIRKLRIRGRAPLRVIAAVSTELRASVSAGRFSAELAEILGTVRIALPPLRDRAEDIPMLATQLIQRIAERLGHRAPQLAPAFHDALTAFAWPGNLAQLEQTLTRLLSACESGTLTAEDFAVAIQSAPPPTQITPSAPRMVRLDDIVQEHIQAVLIGCQGNKLRAAEILGISRSTLYRMLDGASVHKTLSMVG